MPGLRVSPQPPDPSIPPATRPSRLSGRRPILFIALGLLAFTALPALARVGDGTLELRWTGTLPADLPASDATLVLAAPGGNLEANPQDPQGRQSFSGLAPGVYRLEFRTRSSAIGYGVLRTWEIPVAAELTTVATLRLDRLELRVDPAHPDPFGNWETWCREELDLLPGVGAESGTVLDTRPNAPSDAILDGNDLRKPDRLRPTEYGIEGDAAGMQIPLGAVSPALANAHRWIVTRKASAFRTEALLGLGTSGRSLGQYDLRFRHTLGFLGPVELSTAWQRRKYDDAGPVNAFADRLKHNEVDQIETRTQIFLRPAGRGLARFDLYVLGLTRTYFLQEFRQDLAHGPKENRAQLLGSAGYDVRTGPAVLSLGLDFDRHLMETGDGRGFDVMENYRPAPDESDGVLDSLYWQGGGTTRAHLYNYYVQDYTTSWRFKGEGRTEWSPGAVLRAGGDLSWSRFRWYENLKPSAAAQSVPGSPQGAQYVSRLGYSPDSYSHSDTEPFGPRKPQTLSLYVSQRARFRQLALEGGLRWERFRSGQQPLRSFSDPADPSIPLDPERGIQADRLQAEPSHSGIDPRIGAYLPLGGRTHLWADAGQSREEPPFEALYYSGYRLAYQADQARLGALGGNPIKNQIFGNPALKPEVQRAAQIGFLHEFGPRFLLRASAHVAQVRDVWVAVPYQVGRDSLNYYENHDDGRRRQRGLHLSCDLTANEKTRFRFFYDLSRTETNVVEPAPLYRGWLLPDVPVEGTGVRETAPLTATYLETGGPRGYVPSLSDRTHRMALTLLTRLSTEQVGPILGPAVGMTDVALTMRGASGAPYTPTEYQADGILRGALSPGTRIAGVAVNSGRMPWTWQLDLGLRRQFPLFGGNLGLLLEGRNLTDRRNTRKVYTATGDASNDGWLSTPDGQRMAAQKGGDFAARYRDRTDNPLHFDEGFTARAALSYRY